MPSSDTDNSVVVDIDAEQLAALDALSEGCPFGNIYSGATEQPTRQGLRALTEPSE